MSSPFVPQVEAETGPLGTKAVKTAEREYGRNLIIDSHILPIYAFFLLSCNLRELTLGYSCCHVLVSKAFRRNFILITVEILATFRSDNEYEIDDEYDFSIPSRKRVLSCMTPISFLEPHSILFNNAEERGTR